MNPILRAIARVFLFSLLGVSLCASLHAQSRRAMAPADILRIATVSDAQISPNGDWVVYTVSTIEGDQSVSTLWLVRLGERVFNVPPTSRQPETRRNWDLIRTAGRTLLPPGWNGANPRWSPDGKSIAFLATHDGQHGIWVSAPERRIPRLVAAVRDTNFFITYAGESFAWSPDSRMLAYISASEEPDRDSLDGSSRGDDPRVIDRIQYKSRTSFSDRLRTHVWLTDVDAPQSRQHTSGPFYDHALSFSPNGEEIAFLSNHESDPDANNNSDIFATNLQGQVRQITSTPGCEYEPAWSPDGKWIAYTATKRDVTTIDSVAEDTHIWITDAAGSNRRELAMQQDRRARSPRWSRDGKTVFFLAGNRGLVRIHSTGVSCSGANCLGTFPATPEPLIKDERGDYVRPGFPNVFQIGNFSVTATGNPVFAFTATDPTHPAEVWAGFPSRNETIVRLSGHNDAAASFELVETESMDFRSLDGTVQGWLMKPVGWREDRKYPLILSIHGGPHGMYGYAFNPTFQVYAARGYAVLYLNPRGSTGYGQKFSDGTINEWGGGDYRDLMAGVDEALRRYTWIDAGRMGVTGGSYGGFMTNWIVGHTDRFKAAVTLRSVSNFISDDGTRDGAYGHSPDFGGDIFQKMDLYWDRSPLKYARNVKTPTLILHSDNDYRVPIEQGEQWFRALKHFGVTTEIVFFPRENHNLTRSGEPKHLVESMNWQLYWFDRFLNGNASAVPPDAK